MRRQRYKSGTRDGHTQKPNGGWAPSSFSNAASEVDARDVCWGAKAAAEATKRERAATDFMVTIQSCGRSDLKGWNAAIEGKRRENIITTLPYKKMFGKRYRFQASTVFRSHFSHVRRRHPAWQCVCDRWKYERISTQAMKVMPTDQDFLSLYRDILLHDKT